MKFEINVAKKDSRGSYSHLFATAERSLTTYSKTVEVLQVLKEKFPAPEFNLSVSYDPETSQGYSADCFETEFLKDR